MGKNSNTLSNDGTKWTYEDHVIAFNLYCQLPFGKLHRGNQKIIQLAKILGRTPDSVAMKLSNFASLDPSLQKRGIRGLTSISKGVERVWDEFEKYPEHLVFESERLLAEKLGAKIEDVANVETRDLPKSGTERDALVRIRVNQNFFRRRILSAYEYKCCVTGIDIADLLVASHIMPWSIDKENRLNPRNGLCLNALHDRAFDRGLMWVEQDFVVRLSPRLREILNKSNKTVDWLLSFDSKPLLLPHNFRPSGDLLAKHAFRCIKD